MEQSCVAVDPARTFKPIRIAVLTVSDSRDMASDTSGALLEERIKAAGFGHVRIEGLPAADWVLVDAGDIVCHIFRPEVRSFYNLERMWGFGD